VLLESSMATTGDLIAQNTEVFNKFYSAFARKDAATMASLYADNATFYDPVFQNLNAAEVKAMWTMLNSRSTDLTVSHSVFEASASQVKGHWTAHYTFTSTGRKVVNEIDVTMTIQDGKIVDHCDTFDLWGWEIQALGASARLFGCCGFFQSKVRTNSRQLLDSYMRKQGAATSQATETSPLNAQSTTQV